MNLNYTPPPTIERMMLSDALVRILVGPVGSGKSMGAIMELLRRATQQAAHDGVRYTRFAIIRNTLQQLRTTVLPDVQTYLLPLVSYFVTDSTIRVRANLADGTRLVSDWVMIPLDSPEDQQRLLSMQLTGAWINEIREVPFPIVSAVLGRLGRYPSKLQGGPTWFGMIGDTNPWDTDSPYHEALVLNPTTNWELFLQPSGISPQAENVANLPPGYYENLASGRDEDWISVHVESLWGVSNAGQAVFRRSFHAPTHATDMKVVTNPFRPLMVALDLGRTPTALITQVDNYGRLLVFEEVATDDMGLHMMLGEVLRPKLMGEPYAGRRVFVIFDPSGTAKSQYTEDTAASVLKENGFLAYPAPTNDPNRRINAVEKLLGQTLHGEPGLQINRNLCPQLVRAMGNTYRYRRRKSGQLDDLPEKLHPWSDLADALQYAALGTSMNLTGRVMRREGPRTPREVIPVAAWT